MADEQANWSTILTERARMEVKFAQVYATDFHHGTSGHNALMLIDQLADLLNRIQKSGVDIVSIYTESQKE